ncbi:MAG: bis(5'-nucleosyl)-tetraphosphatase (symmetrical) YqeK [Peptostreptococcaceae bacterium]|jgi:predicted HD superfamily hydrolase involved in NAD metabolism|nr:bis(5'-nucleosyl)-tetraphosphatase (symmetrical) YqeK [Peptostreptococcaceae bacterium]
MNIEIKIDEIRNILKKNLKNSRYKHTLGVEKSAIKLAEIYGESTEKVIISSLFHDFAKYMTNEELDSYIEQYDIKLDEIEKLDYSIIHGKVAKYIAENEYNIKDLDILNSIEFHTTGRKYMTKLEKIIYLADYIEENRVYDGVEILRKLAYETSLEEALLESFNNSINFLLKKSVLIHKNTIEARNQILKELKY